MERRSFIRNIALACIAVKVPLKWVPPPIEEGSKGLLWHIQHGGTVVNYTPGSFMLEDFRQLAMTFNESPGYPQIYYL